MNLAPVILPKCRRCSKHRHPHEFVGGHVVGYCWHCYQRHLTALNMLAGAIPPGCQDCGTSVEDLTEINRRAGIADTKLVMEIKDGIYQLLCLGCDAKYQPLRRDLYGKTPYGAKAA